MAGTPDMASCFSSADPGRAQLLPSSPYNALNYHFGMLLGVDDFQTEQAYHRAKMRLHNGWLHREGVVWGYGVRLDPELGEIRVLPGLALDCAGHELHLDADACLNVGAWFDEHRDDADFELIEAVSENGDGAFTRVQFNAHVVIRFKACMTRQVPAILESCDASGTDTAYSRLFETVEIFLRPGLAPVKQPPYHRVRLLFGLDAPIEQDGEVVAADKDVIEARDNLAAAAGADREQACLDALRKFAALDEIEMGPATADGTRDSLFPCEEDEPVVVAQIKGITLTRREESWVVAAGEVDTAVRPTHIATSTIQELLCRCCEPAGTPPAGDEQAAGPKIDPASLSMGASRIELGVDKSLDPLSVQPAAFSVTRLGRDGWLDVAVETAEFDSSAMTINLTLQSPAGGGSPLPTNTFARFIAKGTGPAPLLGADRVPLAGATSDPPATQQDGRDFVFMGQRS